MKKQIKLLLISGIMATIILFITATGVKAATYNIPVTFGSYADDTRTTVTFTLPEEITGVENLETDGWTVNGDTATKENMTRGSTYYYEQTNAAGNTYAVVIAVPMKYPVDRTIRLSDSYTDKTSEDSTIVEVSEEGFLTKAPGRTKLHAKKVIDEKEVEFTWNITVVDSNADSAYYNSSSWELEITGEENDLELNVGEEKSIQIDATLDDEVTPPATAIEPFEVIWSIGDSSVVSLTDTKGDKITNTGKIGSVKLNALKAGTTTLSVQVRIDDVTEHVWTATKTITVTGTPEVVDPGTTESSIQLVNKNNEDNATTSKKVGDKVEVPELKIYDKESKEYTDIDKTKLTVESSDKTVATVENGVVTFKAAGNVTIKYTYTDGDNSYVLEEKYTITAADEEETTGTTETTETTGTEATGKIAQTGSNVAIVLVIIAGFAIIAIISKKKLNK